jgi:hypothetical protein
MIDGGAVKVPILSQDAGASGKVADENFVRLSWIAAKVPTCAFLHVIRHRVKKVFIFAERQFKGGTNNE